MNNQPNNSGYTLKRYVDEVYFPAKISREILCQRSARNYRCLLNKFYEFAGEEARCDEIDDALIDRFYVWTLERGYTEITARHAREAIRSVMRHWNPDKFASLSGVKMANFIEADIAGSLEQIFKDDYLPERTSISSPATIGQYGRCLRLFTAYLGRTAEPCHLTDRIVGKFLRWLVAVQGVKAVTANGYVKQLKALWNWLCKKRVIDRFPTVDKLKQADPVPMAWTREELAKLMAACRTQPGQIAGIAASSFWVAFHYVLFDTGERTGAMLALQWEWIDLRKGYLTVPAEFRKGRQQSMVYALKPATVAAVRAIRDPRRQFIFALFAQQEEEITDRRKDRFYRPYRALIEAAGLPYVKHKTGPQKMRRTFASHIEAAGGNATKALKHRDRRVTEDSYLDPRITEVESENDKLFPLE